MDGAIGDEAARAFAIRFYGALGNRRSVGNAVAQGVSALAAPRLPDELMPRCATRGGLDADDVFLEPVAPLYAPKTARIAVWTFVVEPKTRASSRRLHLAQVVCPGTLT